MSAREIPTERLAVAPDAVLGPATRLLWRTHNCVHLEMGNRAVVVERLPQPVITRLVSRAPRPTAGAGAAAVPVSADVADTLELLLADGFLWPRSAGPDDRRLRPPTPRLAGELTAMATRFGDDAGAVLARRTRSSVVVRGHARVAAHLAALLAAAGVGRVQCVPEGGADGTVRLAHTAPGGVLPGDEGDDLRAAVQAGIERAAPEVDTSPVPAGSRPDLVVLVPVGPVDDDQRAILHDGGCTHLSVVTGPNGGSVGPLVIPGLTACLRCLDLHRRDRDPSWSALAAQLRVPTRHGSSCDVAAEAVVVGTAAAQALAFLDGDEVACVDGTLEHHPPDWRVRRRSWPAHPSCDCGASSAGDGWAE